MNLQASVIIPTFEDWDGLQACLDCLAAQTAAPETFEVIVANNNPSPEVPASLRLPPNARVIHAQKPGSYAARNVALRQSQGDVLFFTDSDCLPDRRWIEAGLAAIAPLGPPGRVAGAIELFPKGEHWTGIELYDRIKHMNQELFFQSGWCATANLVVRRAAFGMVGLFDEDRFSGGDSEWNHRATALGCELVYGADVLIRHPSRGEFAELAKKRRRITGGFHQNELRGVLPKRSLLSYLSLVSTSDIADIMGFPGLTDGQRMKVLWVRFRLGLVELAEIVRLRYLSRDPSRS
jgi:glycosyltransferase involved in cell wall biosynthesis